MKTNKVYDMRYVYKYKNLEGSTYTMSDLKKQVKLFKKELRKEIPSDIYAFSVSIEQISEYPEDGTIFQLIAERPETMTEYNSRIAKYELKSKSANTLGQLHGKQESIKGT